MTVADLLMSLTNALIIAIVMRTSMFVVRTVARVRRHRTSANRRFMRQYHAGHSRNCRTVVKAYLPYSPPLTGPVSRPGRCGRVPAVPAGSSQTQQAA